MPFKKHKIELGFITPTTSHNNPHRQSEKFNYPFDNIPNLFGFPPVINLINSLVPISTY